MLIVEDMKVHYNGIDKKIRLFLEHTAFKNNNWN